MIRVAPEGWPFIIGACVDPGLSCCIFAHWWALLWLPRRDLGGGVLPRPAAGRSSAGDLVIAPADGKVVSVREIDEPAFIGGKALRVSIFMNVFDCHVNRYPTRRHHRVPALQPRQVRQRGR